MPLQDNVHSRVPVLILSIDIAAFADQQLHHLHVPLCDGQVQWGLVPVVPEVYITAALEERKQPSRWVTAKQQANWLRASGRGPASTLSPCKSSKGSCTLQFPEGYSVPQGSCKVIRPPDQESGQSGAKALAGLDTNKRKDCSKEITFLAGKDLDVTASKLLDSHMWKAGMNPDRQSKTRLLSITKRGRPPIALCASVSHKPLERIIGKAPCCDRQDTANMLAPWERLLCAGPSGLFCPCTETAKGGIRNTVGL